METRTPKPIEPLPKRLKAEFFVPDETRNRRRYLQTGGMVFPNKDTKMAKILSLDDLDKMREVSKHESNFGKSFFNCLDVCIQTMALLKITEISEF